MGVPTSATPYNVTYEREEIWQNTDLAFEEIPNHNLFFQQGKSIFDHLLSAKYHSRS